MFLQHEGDRMHDDSLLDLAKQAQQALKYHPEMDKVKDMLRGMLDHAMQRQARSATPASFCKSELSRAQETAKSRERKLEKASADVDILAAKMEKAKLRISDLSSELSDVARGQAELYKTHLQEQKDLEDHTRRIDDAAFKLDRAVTVVKKKNYVLVQNNVLKKRLEPNHFADVEQALQRAKSVGTVGTIPDLEAAQDKNFQARVAARSAALDAENAYNRQDKELKEKKVGGEQESKQLERDLITMKRQWLEAKRDVSSLQSQMKAGADYYDKLRSKCVVETSSTGERAARREDQINSLKEAHAMLNGDAIYVP